MNRVLPLSFAAIGSVGCGADPAPPPGRPAPDPVIHAKESIGAGVGPVGGGPGAGVRRAGVLAPDWAKPKAPATNR